MSGSSVDGSCWNQSRRRLFPTNSGAATTLDLHQRLRQLVAIVTGVSRLGLLRVALEASLCFNTCSGVGTTRQLKCSPSTLVGLTLPKILSEVKWLSLPKSNPPLLRVLLYQQISYHRATTVPSLHYPSSSTHVQKPCSLAEVKEEVES